jgi:hypothetical protein
MLEKIKNLFKSKKQKEAEKYKVDATPLDPKTAATANKEPWVAVLQTHVNPESPRNGFFELDWNEYFVLMLRKNGYTGITVKKRSWINGLAIYAVKWAVKKMYLA